LSKCEAQTARREAQLTSDQVLVCTVCGTSFLWTVAEQREQRPDRCPMCRRLAPTVGRRRGIVKWYSRGKGYGFITTSQDGDVFLHKSGVVSGQVPCAGQLVEFDLTHGPHGVQAANLEILATSPNSVATPC
jgi:CspA family cold shock protein